MARVMASFLAIVSLLTVPEVGNAQPSTVRTEDVRAKPQARAAGRNFNNLRLQLLTVPPARGFWSGCLNVHFKMKMNIRRSGYQACAHDVHPGTNDSRFKAHRALLSADWPRAAAAQRPVCLDEKENLPRS
jgi:hypothetical protein